MNRAGTIDGLRSQLDAIDADLLDTLRRRIACCVEIGQLKQEQGIPMMQPHRIGLVQERAARYAVEHGINPAFLQQLYDLVIAETCRVEDLVMSHGKRA